MSLERPEYVSDLIVYLLNELGVEYAPLNPGATTGVRPGDGHGLGNIGYSGHSSPR